MFRFLTVILAVALVIYVVTSPDEAISTVKDIGEAMGAIAHKWAIAIKSNA